MITENYKTRLQELAGIENSERDIIVTIPKSIQWSEYEKELKAVEDYSQVMNFKVNHFPKTKPGNKCYLLYGGQIIGWMEITGISEKDFTCSTTGKQWKGKFIERQVLFIKFLQ